MAFMGFLHLLLLLPLPVGCNQYVVMLRAYCLTLICDAGGRRVIYVRVYGAPNNVTVIDSMDSNRCQCSSSHQTASIHPLTYSTTTTTTSIYIHINIIDINYVNEEKKEKGKKEEEEEEEEEEGVGKNS